MTIRTWRDAAYTGAAVLACCGRRRAPPDGDARAESGGPSWRPISSARRASPALTRAAKIKLLREKVKYVFVLFQENRSFDSYFATFPGARGLFSQPPEQTPGFTQPIMNTDGSMATIQPFRIGPEQFAADTDDVDHSYVRMEAKMGIRKGVAHMDRFALEEEKKYTTGDKPSLKAKQYGELAMAYADCDTVPFLWQYASHFTLFDNFFQHTIGPSTPGVIALIAGQTGETQWVKHPGRQQRHAGHAAKGHRRAGRHRRQPVLGLGRSIPRQKKLPYNPRAQSQPAAAQPDLCEPAAHPRRQGGGRNRQVRSECRDRPARRAARPQGARTAQERRRAVGLVSGGLRPRADRSCRRPPRTARIPGTSRTTTRRSISAISRTIPKISAMLHGLGDFFETVKDAHAAGRGRRVLCARRLHQHRRPRAGRSRSRGAEEIHRRRRSSGLFRLADQRGAGRRRDQRHRAQPLLGESAIIITYDESEGDYDHVPPPIIETGPDKGAQPRAAHPAHGDLALCADARDLARAERPISVIRFIDILFDLTPLADLPDELEARIAGKKMFGQEQSRAGRRPHAGGRRPAIGLRRRPALGKAPPLPAASPRSPTPLSPAIPPYGNKGCQAIGMVPTDIARGIPNPIPADFNPRPATNPARDRAGGRQSG